MAEPTTYLRHKANGEIREIVPDSSEFWKLRAEVLSNGQHAWEQTSFPHAQAIKDRAELGELLPEDLGWDDQDALKPVALKLDEEGIEPEHNPHLMLTPGEVEAGMTARSKLEDMKQQFHEANLGRRREIFDGAADRIADEQRERRDPLAHAGGKGMLARAGGSDERANVPMPDASEQESRAGGVDDSGELDSDASASGETPAVAGPPAEAAETPAEAPETQA